MAAHPLLGVGAQLRTATVEMSADGTCPDLLCDILIDRCAHPPTFHVAGAKLTDAAQWLGPPMDPVTIPQRIHDIEAPAARYVASFSTLQPV